MKCYPLSISLTSSISALFFFSATAFAQLPTDQQWRTLAVKNDTIWLGSHQGQIARSNNAGRTFELSHLANNAPVRQLYAVDEHLGYALTTGLGQQSSLYITRNGGFSWRPVYQGSRQEQLACMAFNTTGEAWILGNSQEQNWHVVRSNNGRHWHSSRAGFTSRPLAHEQASTSSDNCLRFENNTWLMGTQSAAVARIMYKDNASLRFQVLDTPLSAGEGAIGKVAAGVHAVWPLDHTEFLIAGGNAEQGELYYFNQENSASEGFQAIQTPSFNQAIQVLYVHQNTVYIGNENAFFRSPLAQVQQNTAEWQLVLEGIGARSFSCNNNQCWLLGSDNQLHSISPE